jgi:hypothetical protein
MPKLDGSTSRVLTKALKELTLYLHQKFRPSVLEIAERLPEAEAPGPSEWANNHRQRVEFPPAAQEAEC